MYKLYTVLVLAFLLLTGTKQIAFGQKSIVGKVIDQQTGNALKQATLYLPELHRGTVTDESGNFILPNLPESNFLLQVSYVGYRSFVESIRLYKDTSFIVQLIPSTIQMKEVVIAGQQVQVADATSFTTSSLAKAQFAKSGALNVADALSILPGISQLSTGPGITKPVIRGLYGNRIQINLNGVRFDNQQWQDEHGLGISTSGVERVDVIHGPASVLYGSDALGGVINIIEERSVPANTSSKELNTKMYSNTYGFSLEYASKKADENSWRNFRFSADNHADYNDGDGNRVLNSRFASYNFKESWGRMNKNRVQVLRVMTSHSQFGFVFDEIGRKEPDQRLSRSFDGPHHQVSFAQVTNENTFYKEKYKLVFNNGFTSNLRLEDEGGGGISLSMLLNTLNTVAQISRPINTHTELIYGVGGFFQTNTNFGGRIIVPDAITGEASAFVYAKKSLSKFLFELGARYDRRLIRTLATGSLNISGNDSPTQEILPFSTQYNAGNFSLGSIFNLSKTINLKGNISSGYRPGNLAELSSNGLHEGTLRWEIGLIDAAIEQNVNVEASLNYRSRELNFSTTFYHNQFWNYFYLSPTGTEYFGFLVYQYQQSDALLRGGELIADWNPEYAKTLSAQLTYSFIDARRKDGSHLPFIPAAKWSGTLQANIPTWAVLTNSFVRLSGRYILKQNNPAEFETKTNGYTIADVALGACYRKIDITITCTNLLNNQYMDHLSRYKYYGISNMGRNIILNFTFKL